MPSSFLTIKDVRQVQILASSFSLTKKAKTGTKLSGVLISNVKNLLIQSTQFINLIGDSSSTGGSGALMITEDLSNKENSNSLIIDKCTFLNNSNSNGGGLSLINVGRVTVTRSIFQSNRALNSGGGIYFSCGDFGNPQLGMCSLNITETIFRNNLAGETGGGIKWDFYEPVFSNVSFLNNSARIYGDDVASVAKYLVKTTKNDTNIKIL